MRVSPAILAAARKKGRGAPKGVSGRRGSYLPSVRPSVRESAVPRYKDLVPRAVIIRAAEPMAPTRGVRHEFQKLVRARARVSLGNGRYVIAGCERGRRVGRRGTSVPPWSSADRTDKAGLDRYERRQCDPRGDGVYELLSRGNCGACRGKDEEGGEDAEGIARFRR